MKKKPKLLWVSHMIPYPPKAGLLQRSYFLLRELSEYFEIDLLALNQSNLITPYFDSLEAGIESARTELKKYCADVDFCLEPISVSRQSKALNLFRSFLSKHPYSTKWLRSKELQRKVSERMDRGYDFIHVDSIGLIENFDLDKLNRLSAKTCLGHHNAESHMMFRRSEESNNKLSKFIFWLEGKKLDQLETNADEIFDFQAFCSEEDRLRVNSSKISKALVVPNGVPKQVESIERLPLKNRLIFIGTLDWYPNEDALLHFLTDIWAGLKKEFPQLSFDIIGANAGSQLTNLASESEDVNLRGYVDSLEPYLRSAFINVCPIRDGGGTKLKMLEALGYGIPTVSHPVASEGLMTVDGVHLMEAKTVNDYVIAIRKLMNNEEFYSRLSRNGVAHIQENFLYQTIARNFHKDLTQDY